MFHFLLLLLLTFLLSEEELNEIVKLTISEVGATSMKDMGKIMSVIRPKVKGVLH